MVGSFFTLMPNYSAPAQASNVEIDYAANFGSGSVLEARSHINFDPQGAFSVEAWIRPINSAVTQSHIIDLSTNSSFYLKLSNLDPATQRRSLFVHDSNGGTHMACGTVGIDRWSHIALTHNGTAGVKCYVNGVFSGEIPNGTAGFAPMIQLGKWTYATNNSDSAFHGQIDQVKVWARELAGNEVAASMHSWGAPTVDLAGNALNIGGSLRHHYDFNERGSYFVEDKVGSADLTLSGTLGYTPVASVTSVGGNTNVSFPRSYLTSTGGWQVPTGASSATALLVGGGGGGGAWVGGGGGGGGVIQQGVSLAPSSFVRVQVGQGGSGGARTNIMRGAANGQPTSLGTSTPVQALGGGAGASVGIAPGSGSTVATGGGGYQVSGTFAGGAGAVSSGGSAHSDLQPHAVGGGGGAGGNGLSGTLTGSTHQSGDGGPGVASTINGSTQHFGGGGGGSAHGTWFGPSNWNSSVIHNPGAGGLGGGAAGARATSSQGPFFADSGAANTGGGGGGSGAYYEAADYEESFGGAGGSGLIVISYGNSAQTVGSGNCEQTVGNAANVTVTALGNDCIVSFTAGENTWKVPEGVASVRLLIVGGGGAGGGGIGGGGGAGEYTITDALSIAQGTFPVEVGEGGSSRPWLPGRPGQNSSFSTLIAYGGGGGGTNAANGPTGSQPGGGSNFGSAGGGGYENNGGTATTRTAPNMARSATSGGNGTLQGGVFAGGGGGGGGSGPGSAGIASSTLVVNGQTTQTNGFGGNGGGGLQNNISGTNTSYVCGGGGGINGQEGYSNGSPGSGGCGPNNAGRGGLADTNGNGVDNRSSFSFGVAGAPNTGSGGGGASNWVNGGNGGSGIVIVRYTLPITPNPTFGTPTATADGFTVQVTNYLTNSNNTNFQWAFSSTLGSAAIDSAGLVTVSGVSGAATSTLTATVSKTGYRSSSATASATSVPACSPSSTQSNGYTVLTFTAVQTCGWAPPAGVSTYDVLIVGGGGGGGAPAGNRGGGSGGAGGFFAGPSVSIPSPVTIQVGGGGGGTAWNDRYGWGGQGGDSRIGPLLVSGGGGGATYEAPSGGNPSSGGASYLSTGGGGGGGSEFSARAGGVAGTIAAGGITFNGSTFTGIRGANGTSAPSLTVGGTGGAIAESSRTSSITGTSVVYAKPGPTGLWSSLAVTTRTYGSGGAAGFSPNYEITDKAGQQGVVVIRYGNTYTITYDENGADSGSASSATSSHTTSGSAATLATAGTMVKAGYSFAGWSLTPTGAIVSASYAPTTDLTLYAKWNSDLAITTPTSGLSGTFGSSYSLTVASSGGAGTKTFSLVSGTLPSGLSLGSASGEISGTPTQAGSQAITVRVTDADSNTATTASFTITINSQTLANAETPTVTATSGVLKSISVSWNAVTSASSYNLKIYAADGTTLLTTLTGLSGVSKVVTASDYPSIADNTEYRISITAIGSGNFATSAESAKVSVTTNQSFTVTYEEKGGSTVADGTFVTGGTVTFPANPIKLGYRFDGWSETDGGAVVTTPYSPGVTQGLTLFAVWQDSVCSPTESTFTGNGTNGGNANTFYRVYSFSSVDNCRWAVPSGIASIEALLVAGGGGGGAAHNAGGGGGGGAGQVKRVTLNPSSVPEIIVHVGAGGLGGTNSPVIESHGTSGANTNLWVSGSLLESALGGEGGSRSRADYVSPPRTVGTGGATATSNAAARGGAFGGPIDSASFGTGGGGGGAGGAGGTATSQSGAVAGGLPLSINISGTNVFYGRGGAGSNWWNAPADGVNALANTGNGGGAARAGNSNSRPGGSGGSGVVVFRVEATPANYTVTFNANLGTGTMASQTIVYNTATNLTTNSFTRDGFKFMGWNTAADGSGTPYSNAQTLTLTSTSPTLSLFAQWQQILSIVTPTSNLSGVFGSSYSLTLSTAGGAGTNAFSLVTGSLPPGLSLGSASGEISGTSTQAGSYPVTIRVTDVDGNIATTSSFTIVISSQVLPNAAAPTVSATALTLKSIQVGWTAVANASSYTLRIYAADGTTLLQTLTALSGTARTITASDFSGIADGTEYRVSITAVGTGNWATSNESAKSSVTTNSTRVATFDSNGGTAVTSINFITGASIALPANPTKSGLYFGGWSTTESSDQGDLTNRVLSWPFTPAQDSSLTLHAIWLDDYSLNLAGSAPASARKVGTAQNPVLIVPANQSFTWESWIYPVADSSRAFFTILDNADVGDNWGRAALYMRDSGSGAFLQGGYFSNGGDGNWAFSRTNSIPYETWTHVAMSVTRTGASENSNSGSGGLEIRLYINGVRVGVDQAVWTSGDGFTWSGDGTFSGAVNSRGLIVGDNVDDPNQQFKGRIDQVKVWDGVLTNAEVAASRVTFGKGSIAKNLRAHYSLNDLAASPSLGGVVQNLTNSTGAFDLNLFATTAPAVTANVTRSLNDFSITYDSNSATSGSVSSGTDLRPYQTLNLATKGDLVRTGYTFSSWNTNSAGTGSNLAESASYQVLYSSPTLFAKWTANTYTVTYDYNGADGGNTLTSGTYTTDSTALSLPTPTRTGFVFDGWFDDAAFSGTALGSTITTTSSKTIYAKWTPGTYTITYNYNGADGGNAQATGSFTTGGIALVLPSPTKTGYIFGGWFDAANFSGTALSSPTTTTISKTIHAKWVADSYTVLYEYNGADGGNSTTSSAYTTGDPAVTLPVPARTGYTFSGWFESATFAGSSLGATYTTSQNRTVYAKWTAINYRIIYNPDIVVSGNTISPTSGSVPTNNTNYNIGQTGPIASNFGSLARTGYTFAGWVTSIDGTGNPKNSGDTVTFGAANVNLYPQWTANTYSISYNLNGGSGSLSGAPTTWTVGTSNVTLPSSGFTKTGYDFAGWARSQGGTAVNNSFNNIGDVTLYALWNIKTINYSFDKGTAAGLTIAGWPANSSSTFGTNIALPNLSGTIVTISSQSFMFFGWKHAGSTFESGDSFTLGETPPVFEAQWVKVFDVRYGFAGGTHSQAGDADEECVTGGLCTDGQPITLRTAPTRIGFTFDGWKVQDNNFTKAAGSSHVVTATAYLFYAQWTAIDYDFSYNSMGGSNVHASVTANIGQVITMPNPGSRTGYSFGGWSPDGGTTLLSIGSSFVVGSESKSFVAYWVPDVYTVVFDWQGATGSVTPNASFTVGTGALSLPTIGDRVRDGYTFAGWATSPSGSVLQSFTPTANSVLYAVWNDGSYTLSFDSQGGQGSGVGSVARGASYTLPTPVRQGFVFLGWFDQVSGGSKLGDAGQSITPGQSRTFFGRWVQRSLYGVDEANLETATEFVASASNAIDATVTNSNSASSARVEIPAGALPNGTRVKVRYFRDTTRQQSLISNTNTYVLSVLVSWLYGSGATATVPDTNAGKSIRLTLTNNLITAGAVVYMVVGNQVTELARATQDGTVTVNLTEDPEIVVAIAAPGAPTNVVAVAGDTKATVTWSAPALDGGSAISSYVVTASTGQTCTWTTGPLSCEITGLANGTSHSFTVRAVNAVGNSANSQPATATPAAPSAASNPAVGGTGPAAGIKPVSGQTRVWTKRISANQVKVYIKFPEMGSNYQINLQKNNGVFRRVVSKTINTTADTSLRVVGPSYYLVRTIDLPGEGRYRIEVTVDGERMLLNGKDRPKVFSYL